jgi:membrane protein implicated in regulation of membrane protease activity
MDAWVIWLIVAVALGVGEVLTLSFFLGPFAIGALVASVISAAGAGILLSAIAFLVVSVLTLLLLRPVARRHLRTPAALRTNTAALVGEVWTARPFDDDHVIEAGRRVHVLEIRGATALVSE